MVQWLMAILCSGNVWRIAELKIIGKIMFSELIDFGHKDIIYVQAKIWLVKFGKSQVTCQFCQTFPLPTFLLYVN